MGGWWRSPFGWLVKRLFVLSAVVAAACGIALTGAYVLYAYSPAVAAGPGGPNAMWAAHKWVGEPQAPEDYDSFAAVMKRHRITDVYFHVGPLTGEGLIPPGKYAHAMSLIAAMCERAPLIRLHAWIGQVERRGGGPLDISDTRTRANIVATAGSFIELGFDGIHYNIEPISSGDPDILALLDETAPMTRARGKLLSLAADELSPFPGAEFLARRISRQAGLWSADYYRQAASRVDQLAVMMYDTTMPFDWLFGPIVAWETYRLLDIVGPRTTLFMGVPSYEERRFGFRPEAENMESGLRGVRIGLYYADPPPTDGFGVAIYAGWTTDEAEWATFRRNWLGEVFPDQPG